MPLRTMGFGARTLSLPAWILMTLLQALGPRGALAGICLLGAGFLYLIYGPRKPELSPVRTYLAEQLVRKATRQLPTGAELGKVMLPPVENDIGATFTDGVRSVIRSRGLFDLAPTSAWERLRGDLRLYPTPRYDQNEINRLLAQMPADTLLVGSLRNWEEDRDRAFGELNLICIRREGGVVAAVHAAETVRKSWLNPVMATIFLRCAPTGQRLFLWFISVFLFPVIVAPLTTLITRRHNRWANIAMALGYTLVLLALTAWMMGPPTAWWQGALFILATLALLAYMFYSCEVVCNIADTRRR